ncbi:16S rRNA (cytosine(967)-C(5))-methyltransferase RsmB [Caldimonas thermodepolymerans]|uniref:16S rRNA (cytosine(967)-C(5))-methyltransferase RsmB n=1 Tax=Caldimonas thermodepolymerans TaxID=215580 RepID=UPI0022357EE7|nr:16S rRNA (cytosine(967)-C(5))-methyltransferase RsmB [Caldimonas thermodepolymerans]UZG44780.1 16S rRNA (cytosine(967)-C(5))-methyltransferase RsmB [Caldimonas thermodepolymerans]
MNPTSPPPSSASLPLSRLLAHTADAVRAVRAGQSLTDALAACPAEARAGTQALSFQVMRSLGRARALRQQLARRDPPPWVDALLLSALALVWDAQAAPYAEHTLVDQAVEAAKQRERAHVAFVNAVLRRFLREREALVQRTDADPVARWNHPSWWLRRLWRDWPQHWQALCEAAGEHPPMTLRVHARRGTPEAYLERLRAAGLAGRAVGPYAVQLDEPVPVQRLPGFEAGDVSVQDLAAQWAAPLLVGAGDDALPTGARVLDACAAPGGKTAHLLELADLDVLALDSDPARLARVGQTLGRIGLHAELKAADARQPDAFWDGRPFDAILLDAPCSASGVVRRHPDVRWLRRDSDIEQLAAVQRDILHALWPLLRPGGRLLYCTCSVFRAEGQQQIDAFLQRTPEARLLPSPGHALPLPDNGAAATAPGQGTAAHDGFYYALLRKRPD